MRVLEDHQQRLLPRQRHKLPDQGFERPLALALRREVRRRVAIGIRNRQKFGEQSHIFRRRRCLRQQHLKLFQFSFRRVVASQSRCALSCATIGYKALSM